MSFISSISQKILAGIDLGEDTVSALIGENKGGRIKPLGLGEAPTRGIVGGRIENIGDAVESVVAATRQAQERAGVEPGVWYVSFFDPDMECVVSRGSKTLKGEGQIRPLDLRDVRHTAERLVGHFEKNLIYSKEAGYTIDERDFVANPLGVFGRKLEVEMRILLARSFHLEAWQKVLDRSELKKTVPVVSAWATAYGILPKEDRERPRLIVDAGRRCLNIFIFGNNMIYEHRSAVLDASQKESGREAFLLQETRDFAAARGSVPGQVLITARRPVSADTLETLRQELGKPVSEVSQRTVPDLEDRPTLVGLLMVADELENKSPILHQEKGLFVTLKGKAASFLSDYF